MSACPPSEFRFRPEYVVVGHAQIGGRESQRPGTGRHYRLANDVVADPHLLRHRLAQELQHRPPFAPGGHPHPHQQLLEPEQVDREHPHVAVGVAQIPVISRFTVWFGIASRGIRSR